MLSILLAVALALQPDGTRLHPYEACYAIYAPKAGSEDIIGATWQSLRRDVFEKRPVWRVVVHQRLADGRFDLRDDFILDAHSLRPIRLETTSGAHPHAQLDYGQTEVNGFKVDAKGTNHVIHQVLTGAVWEGNLFGPTFAALPLAVGATFAVPYYQYDRGLGTFTVKVVGSRRVATPAGDENAWVLDAGPNASERLTYLIAKGDGRELGYSAPQGGQRLGGDCTGIT